MTEDLNELEWQAKVTLPFGNYISQRDKEKSNSKKMTKARWV